MAIVTQRAVPGAASSAAPAPGPGSQKADVRPISFLLYNGGLVAGPLTLNIRPEELTSEEPSRLAVKQTLGGAWADSFGAGLRQITIQGHTGWRGGPAGDGRDFYFALRDIVYTRWHGLRAANLAAGTDPETVELIFADHLDDIVAVVAPQRFHLRRHRTKPLLYQYQIAMTVLGDASVPQQVRRLTAPDPIIQAIDEPETRYEVAKEALAENAAQQHATVARVVDVFGAGSAPARFAAASAQTLDTVIAATTNSTRVDAVIDPVVAIAQSVERAGRNAFQMLIDSHGVIQEARGAIQLSYALFGDALCNLANGFAFVSRFLDLEALFGASNCSSTGGGRPSSILSDINPFELVHPVDTPLVQVSQNARASLVALAGDPVLAPLPSADVLYHLGQIADGIA